MGRNVAGTTRRENKGGNGGTAWKGGGTMH